MEYIVHHEGGEQPSGALQQGLEGLINKRRSRTMPMPVHIMQSFELLEPNSTLNKMFPEHV